MALILDSKQFAAYHAKLADRFKETVLRGVRSGAARAVTLLVQRTRAAPPANPNGVGSGGAVNTGALVRGWRYLQLPDGAMLINNQGHAAVVDGGRRIGGKMPPREALIPWIRRRMGKTEEEAKRLYFPIARAIKRRGLMARRILTGDDAKTEILNVVTQEVVSELEREASRK